MNAPPDMLEFSRLLQRWLDQTAADAEATRLWEMVGAHPECAGEMAAATRMEGLLEQCHTARSREVDATGLLFNLTKAKPAAKQEHRWQRAVKTVARIAAVLALTGGIAWWAMRDAAVDSAPTAVVAAARKTLKPQPMRPLLPPLTPAALRQPVITPETDAPLTPEQLSVWLDQYFLTGINLEDVTLREALAQLQAEMLRLNFFGTDIESRLRLTVAADAAERRVSLKSPPISFLKAVQALAALAGCDVVVGDRLIAVQALPQSFPQPSMSEDLRNVLAGLLDANGVPEAESSEKVEQVRQDALRLGFLSADADATSLLARLTRGEIEALRFLAEARAQLAAMPRRNYQVGVAPEGTYGPDRVLTPEEAEEIRAERARQGTDPIVSVQPSHVPVVPIETPVPELRLVITPVGEGLQATLVPTAAPSTGSVTPPAPVIPSPVAVQKNNSLPNQPVIASANISTALLPSVVISQTQGAVLTVSAGLTPTSAVADALGRGLSASSTQSTSTTSFGLLQGTSLTSNQIVILPINTPTTNP